MAAKKSKSKSTKRSAAKQNKVVREDKGTKTSEKSVESNINPPSRRVSLKLTLPLALIAIVVITLVLFLINNSNQPIEPSDTLNTEETSQEGENEDTQDQEDNEGSSEDNESNNDGNQIPDNEGDMNEETENGTEENVQDLLQSGHSEAGYNKSQENQRNITSTGIWTPTDYQSGDIVSSSYTVQVGDTLWEIAEGYYGDPFLWTEILNRNSGSIGFLPNGEQALIFPNQVLNL